MKLCSNTPCPTCPWRKSSTVGGADIEGFEIEKMRNLVNTAPPKGSDQDGFYSVMACHHSEPGKEYACAGYLAQHGEQNIAVRLMVHMGHVDLLKVQKNCEGIDLYGNFHEMLADFEKANPPSTTNNKPSNL